MFFCPVEGRVVLKPSALEPSTATRGETRPAEKKGEGSPEKRARTRVQTKRPLTDEEAREEEETLKKIQKLVASIVALSPEEDDASVAWGEVTTRGVEPDRLNLDELSVEEVLTAKRTELKAVSSKDNVAAIGTKRFDWAIPPVRLGLSGNSGKIPERPRKRSQSVSWNSPREYGWDPPSPIIRGI